MCTNTLLGGVTFIGLMVFGRIPCVNHKYFIISILYAALYIIIELRERWRREKERRRREGERKERRGGEATCYYVNRLPYAQQPKGRVYNNDAGTSVAS